MNVTHVLVRRKFNLGNYQTLDLQLEADIEPLEKAKDIMAQLERMINDYYQGRTASLADIPQVKREAEK